MEKLSLYNLVNKYLDDEKKRRNNKLSKSARNEWIKGDVTDEITALNNEYSLIIKSNDSDARTIFEDRIKVQFKTQYFESFILNKSNPIRKYYKDLLSDCIINNETIEDFLNPKKDSKSNPKTVDFFTAFCKNQEREYGQETTSSSIPRLKRTQPLIYVNTEKFSIAGATIIDKEFINEIKKKEFSMAEFYTAKQNEDCQWYGIIKHWDIERTIYPEVKVTVENCFAKERSYKVSAVIHGEGGSGKSTLLRRLAIDLSSSEKFKIIWLYDFEEFLNGNQLNGIPSGWEEIKNDHLNRYIILIEDLHKNIGSNIQENLQNISLFKNFLKKVESIKNIRLVIGDRYMHIEYLKDHLYDDRNSFLLLPTENRVILQRIVQKIPEWKSVINENLFEKLGDVPLFVFLFIIAKISESEDFEKLDLSEPHKAFQNIIKSSLKQLADLNCLGLSKALHYWSCIYSEFRILISYESLLVLANHFNTKNDRKPKEYKNYKLNSSISNILSTYIGVKVQNEKLNYQIFYFNHDILTDSGLSKISFSGWDNYDELLLKKILNIMVEKGDEASASVFLNRMLRFKPTLFETKQEKLEYINKLIDRGVHHSDYVIPLVKEVSPSVNELNSFAQKLWNINHYNRTFWFYILNNKELQDKWSEIILNSFDVSVSHPEIISLALNHNKDKIKDGLAQRVCDTILKEDIFTLHLTLACSALKISTDRTQDGLTQQACNKVLEKVINDDVLNVRHQLVTVALKHSTSKQKNGLVQSACNKILTHPNRSKLPNQIIFTVLKLKKKIVEDNIPD